jgi:hypothetical protein
VSTGPERWWGMVARQNSLYGSHSQLDSVGKGLHRNADVFPFYVHFMSSHASLRRAPSDRSCLKVKANIIPEAHRRCPLEPSFRERSASVGTHLIIGVVVSSDVEARHMLLVDLD